MKLCYLVVVAVALFATRVQAQPGGVIGRMLPSPDLPVGTIVVRVVDGSPTSPQAKIKVTLTVDKAKQTAVTDDIGRARFENLAAGQSAQLTLGGKEPTATSEKFTIPSTGGVRVMLSTKAIVEPARKLSGHFVDDESATPGTMSVRLTYDNLYDPKPPAGVVVSLVGYAADDTVSVVTAKSDAKGFAQFTKLDTTGTVAYYALAQLPRKKGVDRLVAEPVLLWQGSGVKLILSGEQRTASAPAVDDLVAAKDNTTAVAKGKVRVRLEGAVDPNTKIELVDAATGKAVATGTAAQEEAVIAVAVKPGQLLYATAASKNAQYRSKPFEMVTDRGAAVSVWIYPRVLPTFQVQLDVDDNLVAARAFITMANNSWVPFADGGRGPTIPLPRGAMNTRLNNNEAANATIKGGAVEMLRALSPGETDVDVSFELPAKNGAVAWSLDLPNGTFKSSLWVEKEDGVTFERLPAGVQVQTRTTARGTFLTLEDVTILPKQAMAMTIRVPKLSAANAQLHACRRLHPDASQLIGKPLDFTLARLDGTKLTLSALRGKPVLINLMGSWEGVSKSHQEPAQLAVLAKQVPGLAIVMLASDTDPKEVAAVVGKVPYAVVLDRPTDPDKTALGDVTASWGVTALPESVLLDAKGVVRYHFVNWRDWDSPEATRCMKTFAAAK